MAKLLKDQKNIMLMMKIINLKKEKLFKLLNAIQYLRKKMEGC